MIFVNTFDNLAFTSNNYEREKLTERKRKKERKKSERSIV